MQFEKVRISKYFDRGGGEWIAVEGSLDPGETVESALDTTNKKIVDWHNKDGSLTQSGEIKTDRQPEDIRVAALIADIYSCTELDAKKGGLESYKSMVDRDSAKYPELKLAYDVQFKKLSK